MRPPTFFGWFWDKRELRNGMDAKFVAWLLVAVSVLFLVQAVPCFLFAIMNVGHLGYIGLFTAFGLVNLAGAQFCIEGAQKANRLI